jgi:adenine deaminase
LTLRAAESRVPLTVCPSSNVLIANKYARLEDHPFRQMREAGLLATLNTDDPAMTELNLGTEYRAVAKALRLDLGALCTVALDGIEASWLDGGDKRALRTTFETAFRSLEGGADHPSYP